VASRHATELQSWPLGAVRMTERFGLGDGTASKKQLRALRDHVARELEDAPWLAKAGDRIVGIGGTVRNLAAAVQRAEGVPEFGVQGFVVRKDELSELVARFAALDPADRAKVPGIKYSRADLILAGAAVVEAVLEIGGFPALEATEAGLREGVFFDNYLDGDPPLFDDVRRSSVLNLALQYHMDNAHTEHVARLALGLFDDTAAAGLHPGDARERELLWSACVLHDIGMSVDYDDHHKHSKYLVLNSGLPGFDQREVAIIGQAVRFHRKGMPSTGGFDQLLRDGDMAILDRCALFLRLAEDLERSRDQVVAAVGVQVDGDDEVRLALRAQGDVRVARWAAGREGELFRRALGRGMTVDVA
jgi:exopolyphosphatase/guanosine-5'-triphosphate,3'-diphosphate pyrophosphatase